MNTPPLYWFRFIDDIWSIFWGSKEQLLTFIQHLNSVHNSIKFTAEYSKYKISFLDVWTMKISNCIHTTLFTKPTDSHSYLDFTSCHPLNMKSGIPYSQFLRIRRNCTEWTEYFKHSLQLCFFFQLRGYPDYLILEALRKVSTLSQTSALVTHMDTETTKKFYCVIDYNPTNPNVSDVIRRNFKHLDRSSSTRPIMDIPIVFGNRKPWNLSDYLIRTDVKARDIIKRIPPKCHKFLTCRHCPKLVKTGLIVSTSTSREYKIPRRVTCNSSNVIYCIECIHCSAQYVGQTKNKFLIRVNQHLSDVRTKKETPISRHFNLKHQNLPVDYRLYILQLIQDDNILKRNQAENLWISRLYTITPKGLNILD